jgi:Protein of unknown function (DUF3429)
VPEPAVRAGLGSVPRPALVLGCAGLIPFLAGVLGVWTLGYPDFFLALNLMMVYAAVILAFLGAVHWGLALAQEAAGDWRRLAPSVLPALAGWFALMLPNAFGLLLLAIGFAAVFLADRAAVTANRAPAWYKALRKPLTLVVLACLAACYAALAVRA